MIAASWNRWYPEIESSNHLVLKMSAAEAVACKPGWHANRKAQFILNSASSCFWQQASKQAGKQASKQASNYASEASKSENEARTIASKASRSKQASKPASKQATKHASLIE